MPRPIRLSVDDSGGVPVYYTDDTLNGVTITYGKSTQWEVARAPYMSAQILYTTQPNIPLGRRVRVEMQNHSAVWQPLFTGFITDTSQQMLSQTQYVLQITATGTLGTLTEAAVGGEGYPEQNIKARINNILAEALTSRPINDLTGTLDSNTGTMTNWDNYSAGGASSTMLMQAYTGGTTDAYSLISDTCAQTFSDVIEAPTGLLSWQPVGYNQGGIGAPPSDAIILDNLTVEVDGQNRYSTVKIDAPNLQTNVSIAALFAQFGNRAFDWKTTVLGQTDPQTLANSFLSNSANAGTSRLEGFTLLLDECSTGIQNALINGVPFMGRVVISQVPGAFYSRIGNRFYILGWSWYLTQNDQQISFNLLQSGAIGA
jgi:hypothetical protein